MKLIRRELIEKHELRFPLGYKTCEDQLFTGMLYLKADGISVVADYDCLFIVKRDDGGNITTTTRGADTRIRVLELMVDMVEKQVPAGPDRDGLMNRHLSIDMFHALIHLARESDPELQKKNYQQLAALLERSYPDSLKAQVNAVTRLRCELIQRGMLQETIELEKVDREHRSTGVQPDVLVEGDRAYTRLPFFRDADRGIPDEIYDVTTALQDRHQLDSVTVDGSVLKITGHAYVRRVSQDAAATELVLRERGSKVEHRFPTTVLATPELGAGKEDGGKYRYPAAGFSAEIDLANAVDGSRLPKGLLAAPAPPEGPSRPLPSTGSPHPTVSAGSADARRATTSGSSSAVSTPSSRATRRSCTVRATGCVPAAPPRSSFRISGPSRSATAAPSGPVNASRWGSSTDPLPPRTASVTSIAASGADTDAGQRPSSAPNSRPTASNSAPVRSSTAGEVRASTSRPVRGASSAYGRSAAQPAAADRSSGPSAIPAHSAVTASGPAANGSPGNSLATSNSSGDLLRQTRAAVPLVGEDVLITGAGPIGHHGRRRRQARRGPQRRHHRRQRGPPRPRPHGRRQPRPERRAAHHRRGPAEAGSARGLRHRPGDVRPPRGDARDGREHDAAAGSPCSACPPRSSPSTGPACASMITVKGIYGREMFETWYAMSVLLEGGLDLAPVITGRYGFRDFEAAFDDAASGLGGKVILDWTA
ncbi:L-threonine 3-dehydrogenase [Streptomyces californicus]